MKHTYKQTLNAPLKYLENGSLKKNKKYCFESTIAEAIKNGGMQVGKSYIVSSKESIVPHEMADGCFGYPEEYQYICETTIEEIKKIDKEK